MKYSNSLESVLYSLIYKHSAGRVDLDHTDSRAKEGDIGDILQVAQFSAWLLSSLCCSDAIGTLVGEGEGAVGILQQEVGRASLWWWQTAERTPLMEERTGLRSKMWHKFTFQFSVFSLRPIGLHESTSQMSQAQWLRVLYRFCSVKVRVKWLSRSFA